MNALLDSFVNTIFGNVSIGLVIFNGILGIELILIGIIMNKKSLSKIKRTVGKGFACIGILAVVCAIIQMVLM